MEVKSLPVLCRMDSLKGYEPKSQSNEQIPGGHNFTIL